MDEVFKYESKELESLSSEREWDNALAVLLYGLAIIVIVCIPAIVSLIYGWAF